MPTKFSCEFKRLVLKLSCPRASLGGSLKCRGGVCSEFLTHWGSVWSQECALLRTSQVKPDCCSVLWEPLLKINICRERHNAKLRRKKEPKYMFPAKASTQVVLLVIEGHESSKYCVCVCVYTHQQYLYQGNSDTRIPQFNDRLPQKPKARLKEKRIICLYLNSIQEKHKRHFI